MKQLLFLLLFPCLCVAQYTGNGNQKITLGEQSTADGLVFRGLAADTTRKPSVDTMAYILLDTNTNIIWQYKKATNNAWTRLNLLPSDTTSFNYVNTYGTQTVNGAKTFTSAVTATTFNPTALDSSTNKMYLAATNTLGFSTNGRERVRISETGSLLIGAKTDRLYTKLNVIGGATFQTNDFTSLFFNNTDSRGWGINMAFQDNNTDFGYVGSVGSLLGSTTKDMTVWSTAGNGFRVYTNGNNERMRITSGGNVGIGVTPAAWASAEKAIQLPNDFVFAGGTNVGALFGINAFFDGSAYKYLSNAQAAILQTTKEGAFWFRRAPTGVAGNSATFGTSAYIDSTGNMILDNSITPTQKLHVVGNARITAVGTASASNSALYITNTGVLSTNASDVNKKHNVRNLPYGLSTINNLNPVAFEWNETDETDIGFIAQDIESIIPESVITNWDSELIFRQEKIIPVLVKAIQEQQALIKALEQRILILENK